MVGIKGRSGGKRYAKPDEEKRVRKTFSVTQGAITKLRHIAIAMYGTDRYTIAKALEASINETYDRWVAADLPPTTKQGSFAEFRSEFLNLYRPDINNPLALPGTYLSEAFVAFTRKYAGDRKRREVIVQRILRDFDSDLQEIGDYFLRRKIYFDKPDIAHYVLKYFAGDGSKS